MSLMSYMSLKSLDNGNCKTNTGSFVANNIILQKKLTVGSVNDPLEYEADATADKVMRMPTTNFATTSTTSSNTIQRKCSHCEHEENGMIQRKPLVSFIQKKENSNNGGVVSDVTANQLDATKGNGGSMDNQTQSFMESRFGTGFHDVRIHTGKDAAQLSQQLNAQAFTVGSNIYFDRGKYSPNTEEGKHLLAHELTHTVQQSNQPIPKGQIQRKCTPVEVVLLNNGMHFFCDKPRACNMQTDTCATSIAKVAAGYGCIAGRVIIQQKCFKPGDSGYHDHMTQIAQAYTALRNCESVMRTKCAQEAAKAAVLAAAAIQAAKAIEAAEAAAATTEAVEAATAAATEAGFGVLEILEIGGLLLL